MKLETTLTSLVAKEVASLVEPQSLVTVSTRHVEANQE